MDLLRLEQQRQALEQNLQKLRAALKHWQTYGAELEGLKEEIQTAGSALDFEGISKTYDGELVNEKEICELAGLSADSPRSASQVLGMVSRRQEYVQKNIDTIQKQYWDGESKLEELDFAAISANRGDGSGNLPLTEIQEELDEDGNVVSSRVSQPEAQTTKLVDALRKAGLSEQDIADKGSASNELDDEAVKAATLPPSALKNAEHQPKANTVEHSSHDSEHASRPPIRKKSVSFTADTKNSPEPERQDSEDGRKSVSFNDKVAVMPAAPSPDSRSVSFSPKVEEIPAEPAPPVDSKADSDFQKSLKGFMFKPGQKVAELDDDTDEVAKFHDVIIPEDESEEDAATRREMLEYHLNEVGHVVAQMDLDPEDYEMDEDEVSDFTSSEYQDEDTPYTSGLSDSDVESEDEYGRTKRRVISDDYHKEMQELSRRLIGNLGPAPVTKDEAELDSFVDPQDVHRLVIRGKQADESSDSDKKSSGKKRVSFAEALDVADEPTQKLQKLDAAESVENVAPMAEEVSERVTTAPKMSAFKAGRAAKEQGLNIPTPPTTSIIADQLLERPTRRKSATAPSEDGVLSDPISQRRELAAEYYRRRNDIIRQQGGFKNNDEDDDGEPLMEERGGKMKKVSKFKAARIRS
ncbi:uncharacterized protein MYCFIDRAFT_76841 [Pseudocercospora fijiensis CIRAD86]|uniref:DUF3835 domain-containing protein n=1 Tax=Pseudocercospora fijiensis (strain CIRAD86) TaxID=383855 RepID=N1QBJ2_PSEFD|nr:uncharacterized protein MYCFIDRAFT_76841 [Pseudocercospora fijiensis CIRAD86]EME89496.1 hypothetical protein MYCFIDRAFT_76841 [Pseudocercospora fijiensis CIRAD86]